MIVLKTHRRSAALLLMAAVAAVVAITLGASSSQGNSIPRGSDALSPPPIPAWMSNPSLPPPTEALAVGSNGQLLTNPDGSPVYVPINMGPGAPVNGTASSARKAGGKVIKTVMRINGRLVHVTVVKLARNAGVIRAGH